MKQPEDFVIPPEAKSLGIVLPPGTVPGGQTVATKAASKYRNVPTIFDGQRYDSKAEADRAKYWSPFPGTVVIRQPRFRLGVPENVYVADFLILLPIKDGTYSNTYTCHVEDVKGHETAKFKRDRKLWKAYGNLPLHIIRSGTVAEIIYPEKLADE